MSDTSPEVDLDFEAEDDVRTLVRAEEIRKDKPRLKRAMKKAREQMTALENVSDGGKR